MERRLSKPTVDIHINEIESIIEVKWHGHVSLEDCKIALDFVKNNLKEDVNLIINRKSLDGFDDDARKWLKTTFLKEEAKSVIPYLLHLATVESTSRVRIFSLAINQLTSILFPKLNMKSFTSVSEAMLWISEGKLNRAKQLEKTALHEGLKAQKPENLMDRIMGLILGQ